MPTFVILPAMNSQDAQRYIDLDKAHVWHPFTAMRQWAEHPDLSDCIIADADGFELIDVAGRRWIDGFGSLWCNLHGHRVAQIDAAIRRQLERVAHSTLLGFGSLPSIELAARLAAIMPPSMAGLTKAFFSDSGATAIEVAIKMAYQYYRNLGQPGRRKFIAFREGYHGDTIGSVSLGGVDTFHRLFRPLLFETLFVDTPNAYYSPHGPRSAAAALEQVDKALSDEPGAYCGVFIEPLVQAAGGMLTAPAGFLRDLRELTARHDVLLIADEVATGFGRTGKLFACEHEGVQPDILCLGKGLTGGYLPVAATMTTRQVFDAFGGEVGEGRTFYHGHTFTGNALGCAAAVASIDLIFDSGLLQSLPAKAELMARHLSPLAKHPHVADIRQCGMMVGIELVQERRVPFGAPGGFVANTMFEPSRRVGAAVCSHARKHGLIIRPLDDIVVLMPAPAMDLATLERMMQAVVASVQEYFEP